MLRQKRKRWTGLLLTALFIVTACNGDVEQKPTVEIRQLEQPDKEEVEQVIEQFLNREGPIPFKLWTTSDGETVASMEGMTEENRWELEGRHNEQSYVQLSGRQDKVEWKTKKSSGVLKQTAFGLYSPHEHLKQLQHSFQGVELIPGNRFEQQWNIVHMSLTDEKVKQAVMTTLGEQFATPEMAENIAQKMEVSYTLWYNKQSGDLHQIKVELHKKGDNTLHAMQSLTYLFGESSE